jgi:hypothetical protein
MATRVIFEGVPEKGAAGIATRITDRTESRTEELQPLLIRLTPDLDRRLRERAEADDRSLAATMRQALIHYLEELPV